MKDSCKSLASFVLNFSLMKWSSLMSLYVWELEDKKEGFNEKSRKRCFPSFSCIFGEIRVSKNLIFPNSLFQKIFKINITKNTKDLSLIDLRWCSWNVSSYQNCQEAGLQLNLPLTISEKFHRKKRWQFRARCRNLIVIKVIILISGANNIKATTEQQQIIPMGFTNRLTSSTPWHGNYYLLDRLSGFELDVDDNGIELRIDDPFNRSHTDIHQTMFFLDEIKEKYIIIS